MRILEKQGDEISVVALPSESVYQGDYLEIADDTKTGSVVVQVYEEMYIPSQSLTEDIIRDQIIQSSANGTEIDPFEISSVSQMIKDMRLLKCKIRGSIQNGLMVPNVSWLPSRARSKIRKISQSKLLDLSGQTGSSKIRVGTTKDGEEFIVLGESLDGNLSIITGKKESGKSHLSKILVSSLVASGAVVVIFDLNNEYEGLSMNKDGSKNELSERLVLLEPGKTLRFALDYLGEFSLISLMQHVLDAPGASLREFTRIINSLEHTPDKFTMDGLGEAIQSWRCNELVKDAIHARYQTMKGSGIFAGAKEEGTRMDSAIRSLLPKGGAVIVSLKRSSSLTKKMVVEIILSKLVQLLERDLIPPIFLFAEEAHLYLRETYWDDIVTRMRHFGIFTTLITNQPDAINDGIYRQADNIFLFNFTNATDLDMIARASTADSDTIKSIVRTLPRRHCLILGKVVSDLPMLVKVGEARFMPLGQTKKFFGHKFNERRMLVTATAK
ncbi:MAG: ATP-binding protein [Nitrososphaerota archaeon]|nr:ATP-binding protein [Nitrososphaerota archaeon]